MRYRLQLLQLSSPSIMWPNRADLWSMISLVQHRAQGDLEVRAKNSSLRKGGKALQSFSSVFVVLKLVTSSHATPQTSLWLDGQRGVLASVLHHSNTENTTSC